MIVWAINDGGWGSGGTLFYEISTEGRGEWKSKKKSLGDDNTLSDRNDYLCDLNRLYCDSKSKSAGQI